MRCYLDVGDGGLDGFDVAHDFVDAIGRTEDAYFDGAVAAETERPPAAPQVRAPACLTGEMVEMFRALDAGRCMEVVHHHPVEAQSLAVAVIAEASQLWEVLTQRFVDANGVFEAEAFDVHVHTGDSTCGTQAIIAQALRDLRVARVGVHLQRHVSGCDLDTAHPATHEACDDVTFLGTSFEIFAKSFQGVVGSRAMLDLAGREFAGPPITLIGVGSHPIQELLCVGIGPVFVEDEKLALHSNATITARVGKAKASHELFVTWRPHFVGHSRFSLLWSFVTVPAGIGNGIGRSLSWAKCANGVFLIV